MKGNVSIRRSRLAKNLFFARSSSRRQVLASLLAFSVLTLLASDPCRGAELSANQLKTLYLFNFAKFAKWKGAQRKAGEKAITIGILGSINFAKMLPLIDGKTFARKSVIVKQFNDLVTAKTECQILFIGDTGEGISEILASLEGTAILTVSEIKNFARRGGMVEMYLQQNIQGKQKLVFDVNLTAIRREDITLNSRVLKLANKRIR